MLNFFGYTVRSSSVSSSVSSPHCFKYMCAYDIMQSEKHWGAGQYSSLIFNFSILFFNL